MQETLSLAAFVEPVSLTMIFGSTLLIAFSAHASGSTSIAVVCRDLGTPLGLLGAMIGAFGISLNMREAADIYPVTAILLIAVLYGGLISGIGMFIGGKAPAEDQAPKSPYPIYTATVFVSAALIWAMENAAGLEQYLSPVLFGIFAAVFGLALATARARRTEVLADASLFAALLCVIAGLVARLSGYIYEGLQVSMGGLVLGLFAYIIVICMSYASGSQRDINAMRQNWHWLELTGFLIFMYLAPETIREALISAA